MGFVSRDGVRESSVALNNCTLRVRVWLQADYGRDALHRRHEMRATGVYPEQLVGIDRLEEGVLQLECQVAEAGTEALRGHETGLIGEGTHQRAVITVDRFMDKCQAKLAQ